MDFLGFLDGISAWWWIAFAVALGAVEMLTFTYFLLWLSLAAFGVGLTVAVMPGMSGMAQLSTFAVLSVALTVAGRWWMSQRKATPSDVPGLNRRSERVIGRTGKALVEFENLEGIIIVDGVRWKARLTSGTAVADQALSVIDADGMMLICEPI
ncbi:MAG: NfeD family protein [Pseudomonadota bacterium]